MALPSSARLAACLALLAAFWIVTSHLAQDSLWLDEGYSAAVVRDVHDAPQNLRLLPGYLFHSLRDTLNRSRADVHPPLYFLLLDSWGWVAGESVFALRLLSAFFGLIALAATYALGKRLFGAWTGLAALLILATASAFVYYNRETRMYTLLIALSALSMWAYWRWLERPTWPRVLLYGGLMAALLYTHDAGVLILLTQALHLLLSRPRRILRWLWPAGLALLCFAPWIPVILAQWRSYGQPGAPPFSDLGVALAALSYALTGGYLLLYLLPALGLIFLVRRQGRAALLLALWLLLTPLALWLGNALIPSLFQVRYTLAILPAAALLLAGGLMGLALNLTPQLLQVPSPLVERGFMGEVTASIISVILLAALLYTQLTLYPYLWPAKPDWDSAVRQVATARQPLEPALTAIPNHSPAAYYARQIPLEQGLRVDLGWRWQEPEAMASYAEKLDSVPSVWLMMPSSTVSTWDAARDLLATRHVGYRESVMDMLFYRFDTGSGEGLRFQFGDALAYPDGIGQVLYAVPGEDFCFTLALEALANTDAAAYQAEIALTQGYDTIRAQTDVPLEAAQAGETLHLAPCLSLLPDTPAGTDHLRLRITDAVGQALPLIEDGSIYWGETLVLALVHVGE